jgi:hypothetical protein
MVRDFSRPKSASSIFPLGLLHLTQGQPELSDYYYVYAKNYLYALKLLQNLHFLFIIHKI